MGHPDSEDLATVSTNVDDMSETKGRASNNHVAGDALLVANNGRVRQIPAPTTDPNDPLNFSRLTKIGITLCCCWFSSMSLVTISGLGGVLGVFFKMYIPQGYSSTQVVSLATVPTLCIGLGNFIILPATMMFGRRPVFLAASVITLATTLWAALQNSWESHMAARVLMGFATGATESLLPLIITDITFLYERSFFFGMYWSIQSISSAGLSIAATYEVAALGWRWYYWVLAIMTGVGLVLTCFLSYETRFTRPPTYLDGQVIVIDEFGATLVLSDEEARERLALEPHESHTIDTEIEKKTYLQRIKPFESMTPNGPRVALNSLIAMARSYSSPGVVFAVFAAAISLGVGVSVTLTYDELLQKGYGWSAGSVGLVNIGPLISALLAMAYAGYLGDKSIVLQAKRNDGIHLPEHHLVNLIFPGITGIIGLMIYAVSAQHPERYTWVAPLAGWTVYQFSFISTMIITTTFAAEAFPKAPGSSLVVVVGSKNVFAFAASYGLVPMVHTYDYMTAFSILAGIFAFLFLCGIPVYFINPRWRKSYTKKEEEKKKNRVAEAQNV